MTTRWFVEVSPLDADALKERYCVEATQWQQALQQARRLRGDKGPLSRFSIELLDDGYRAVDPLTRLSYLVNKAPLDAALSAQGSGEEPQPSTGPVQGVSTDNGSGHAAASADKAVGPSAALSRGNGSGSETSARASNSSSRPEPGGGSSKETGAAARPSGQSNGSSQAPQPAAPLGSGSVRSFAPPITSTNRSAPKSAAAPAATAPEPKPKLPRPSAAPRPRISAAPVSSASVSVREEASETPKEAPASKSSQPPAPGAPPQPIVAATRAVEQDPGKGLPCSLLMKRIEEPTAKVPIVYREYAYAVEGDFDRPRVERLLRAIFENVKRNLAGREHRKFVQIAIFDHEFTDRPERPPVGTLAWKDWRGDPVVQISIGPGPDADTERTQSAAAESGQTNAARSNEAPTAAAPPPAEAPAAAAPAPAPAGAQPAARRLEVVLDPASEPSEAESAPAPQAEPAFPRPEAAAEPAPAARTAAGFPQPQAEPAAAEPVPAAQTASAAPQPQAEPVPAAQTASAAPQPQAAPAPQSAPAAQTAAGFPQPQAAAAIPGATHHQVDSAAAVSAPPRAAAPAEPLARAPRRRADEDLITELFDLMHELHFMIDLPAGAEYVLRALTSVFACEAILVHVHDIDQKEFVVVRASGPNPERVLLLRSPDTEPLFREALRRTRTLVVADAAADGRYQAERWQKLGVQVRRALCGPVQLGGRYLGIIELVNPAGDDPFYDSEVNALDYVCEQFADFVANRPVVLDHDVIVPGS